MDGGSRTSPTPPVPYRKERKRRGDNSVGLAIPVPLHFPVVLLDHGFQDRHLSLRLGQHLVVPLPLFFVSVYLYVELLVSFAVAPGAQPLQVDRILSLFP